MTIVSFAVSENLVQRIIYAAAEFHNANHRNGDYEVCDHPVCAAARQLEQESGVFDEINGFLESLDPVVLQGAAKLIKEKRKRTAFTAELLSRANTLHKQGRSITQVAAMLNCDRKHLSQHMKAAGYAVRSQGQSQTVRRGGVKAVRPQANGAVEFTREEAMGLNSFELRSGK